MDVVRRLVRAALALAVVSGLYVAVTLAQVWSASRADERTKVDAIVVLGAAQFNGRPSAVLAARLDHALALWNEGLAPLMVVTGGKQDADRFTEAQSSANYLIERGVPDEVIVREVQGRTSWESLAASARILHERGLDSVLLVSDPYHAKRITAIATEVGLDAHVSSTRSSPEGDRSVIRHLVRETAGVALGRFVGYRRLLRIE
jgi:uncharacterized SAM-binding protein YcdF (DUF218 family)